MEYRLIFGSMLATVEDAVNEACKEGWQPHGSLVNTQSKYIQPMIRHYRGDDGAVMWTPTYAVAAEAE